MNVFWSCCLTALTLAVASHDRQVTSLASLIPAKDTSRTPIFANATMKLRLLTGCAIEVNQLALSVASSTRVIKTRVMKWSITQSSVPPVSDSGSEQQQPLQLPVVQNITYVFTRSLQPGPFLQVTGTVSATTRGSDVTPFRAIKVGPGKVPGQDGLSCNPCLLGVCWPFNACQLPVLTRVAAWCCGPADLAHHSPACCN